MRKLTWGQVLLTLSVVIGLVRLLDYVGLDNRWLLQACVAWDSLWVGAGQHDPLLHGLGWLVGAALIGVMILGILLLAVYLVYRAQTDSEHAPLS